MEFHDQFVAGVPRQGCLPISSQSYANTFAAMLLQKHSLGADPLSANSRSGSPYMGPQTDANNATGALDAQAMQLPPAAKPLPPAAAPFAAAMHALQQQRAAAVRAHQQHTGRPVIRCIWGKCIERAGASDMWTIRNCRNCILRSCSSGIHPNSAVALHVQSWFIMHHQVMRIRSCGGDEHQFTHSAVSWCFVPADNRLARSLRPILRRQSVQPQPQQRSH
jgi:hypothetical protein